MITKNALYNVNQLSTKEGKGKKAKILMVITWIVGGLLLLIDQLSKYCLERWLLPGQSIPLIENLFQLTLIHNPGGVFGLFSHLPPFFFIIVSLLMIIFLIFLFRKKLPGEGLGGRLSLGLVMGGALGNLIDRLRFGYVIDFLDIGLWGYRWPVFNFADLGITMGIIVLGYKMLKKAS